MNHSNKETLFKLSTLAFCLAALPQVVQAAEEVQQVELKQVNVVGKTAACVPKIKTATPYPPCVRLRDWCFLRGKFPNPSASSPKTT